MRQLGLQSHHAAASLRSFHGVYKCRAYADALSDRSPKLKSLESDYKISPSPSAHRIETECEYDVVNLFP